MLRRAPARLFRRRSAKREVERPAEEREPAVEAAQRGVIAREEPDGRGQVVDLPVAVGVGLARAERAAQRDAPPEARVAGR